MKNGTEFFPSYDSNENGFIKTLLYATLAAKNGHPGLGRDTKLHVDADALKNFILGDDFKIYDIWHVLAFSLCVSDMRSYLDNNGFQDCLIRIVAPSVMIRTTCIMCC